MIRFHVHTRAYGFSLLLWTTLVIPTPSLEAATSHPHPWQHCLDTAAQRIRIQPELLEAIVYTESRNHPWAFGWTDRNGRHHSWYATSLPQAKAMFAHLSHTQAALPQQLAHFDAGLVQVNSRNIARLARQHGLRPVEVLDPCINVTFSAQILEEQLARHGYTWQAIAGYNGSTDYIPLVWTNLCRIRAYADCPPLRTVADRSHPPAPSEPLWLTRTIIRSVTTAGYDSSAPGDLPPLTLSQPETPRSPSSTRRPSSTTTELLSLMTNLLVPFCVLIVSILAISLGLRIVLWSLRGIRTSYLQLTGVRIHSLPLSARHNTSLNSPQSVGTHRP